MAQMPASFVRFHAQVNGHSHPGRPACQILAERLRSGQLDPADVDYLAAALEAISEGKDANTALKIKRDRKRPPKNSDRDEWIYWRVDDLLATLKPMAAYALVGREVTDYGEFGGVGMDATREVMRIYKAQAAARSQEGDR